MKIAISSVGESLDDDIAEVFGRCPYFIIAEKVGGEIRHIETIKNTGDSQKNGAGMDAARIVAEKGAEMVIAKNIGPKAQDVLEQFNIKTHTGEGAAREFLQELIVEEDSIK
jgi:predicted Fe-Mo cluster-binding NifX family protein